MSKLSPEQVHAAKWYLRFFEQIPAEKWCQGTLNLGEKHCALGHLYAAHRGSAERNAHANELTRILVLTTGKGVANTNDHGSKDAKANIVGALRRAIGGNEP